MHGSLPVCLGNSDSLTIRDGDEWPVNIIHQKSTQVMAMDEAMQRSYSWAGVMPDQWKMNVVAVEMNDVEPGYVPKDKLHHAHMMRQGFSALLVLPKSFVTYRHKVRPRLRIAAGE